MKLWICLGAALAIGGVARAADAPVTVTEDATTFKLSNGIATATISKRSGDMTSLVFKDLELMGHGSGHPAGYWEQSPANAIDTITIDPKANGGQRGEVSIKGPSGSVNLEIRYTIGRGESGVYTYAIFSHETDGGPGGVGESRYGAKLNGDVFDWMSIDRNRHLLMPTGGDWDKGSALNMKEARRMTTGKFIGKAEHKYDYSAYQFEIPAFGWSSTTKHVGLYFINPTIEFLSGGATKYELTGHLDDNVGGDPTLLDYWRGTHYGGSNCNITAGEKWSKVIGPIMVYLNSGSTPDEMYKDALTQAGREFDAWPYEWVKGVDYTPNNERATVSGQLSLNDPQASSTNLPNLLVGLAYPDVPATPGGGRGGRGGQGGGSDWQNDAKHYEFWVRADANGKFSIPKVRPGSYELHAIADGVLGEFAKSGITVEPGKSIDLGKLEWKPVRYGRQVWDIGIPNRRGSEFFKGDDYYHWGWYLKYAELFPNDVNYTVGKSDFHKDWFFEQVPHTEDKANTMEHGTGEGNGRATPWTINFDMPKAGAGKATLRLAICGAAARSIDVTLNDQPLGTVQAPAYNATINRDGIGGYWSERDLAFDASKMKQGTNVLKLTIPAGGLVNGIIYDYLRLELDENGQPPTAAAE
jgi:rhamnogalacturonan endolyase